MVRVISPRFDSFIKGLRKEVEKNYPGFCFYGFGSCFNDADETPADIDGGIIVPHIISDKDSIKKLSGYMGLLMKRSQISDEETEFNLIDLDTIRDGRFLSYARDFTEFIRQHATPLSTSQLKWENIPWNGRTNRFDILHRVGFNFRSVRNWFLFSEYYSATDYQKAKEKFEKSARKLKSLPKYLLQLRTIAEAGISERGLQKLVTQIHEQTKTRSMDLLPEKIPATQQYIDEVREVVNLKEPNRQDWARILECFELLIKSYIETFPPQTMAVETVL